MTAQTTGPAPAATGCEAEWEQIQSTIQYAIAEAKAQVWHEVHLVLKAAGVWLTQCAWCRHIIDRRMVERGKGGVSHGMCKTCGEAWIADKGEAA